MKQIICAVAWLFATSLALAQPTGSNQQPRQMTVDEAGDMIAGAIDANHDHRISRAEWLAYWPAPSGTSTTYNPAREFDGYDKNHDGFLDRQEAQPAAQDAAEVAQIDCDENVDRIFSGADELSCLAEYATPAHPAPSASTTPSQPSAGGPGVTLTIDASLRVPGPGRVFAPVANTPVYLSSRDLEQTLAAAGLTQPAPVDAWIRACREHTAGCQQGMAAVRGNDPAARGLTDAQGHFTFTHVPVGHVFVVAIADIAPGHTLIWCVPVNIHAGENELTLAGHNLYVAQDFTPR